MASMITSASSRMVRFAAQIGPAGERTAVRHPSSVNGKPSANIRRKDDISAPGLHHRDIIGPRDCTPTQRIWKGRLPGPRLPDQNLYPNIAVITRGRSGTCDSMNCADEVFVLAFELVRLLPVTCTVRRSLLTPNAAS